LVEAEDVEHFAHTTADTGTVGGLDHGGVEVAGDVGLTTGQVVVTVEDDFGQGIDVFTVVFSLFVGAQVVDAETQLCLTERIKGDVFGAAVLNDRFKTVTTTETPQRKTTCK